MNSQTNTNNISTLLQIALGNISQCDKPKINNTIRHGQSQRTNAQWKDSVVELQKLKLDLQSKNEEFEEIINKLKSSISPENLIGNTNSSKVDTNSIDTLANKLKDKGQEIVTLKKKIDRKSCLVAQIKNIRGTLQFITETDKITLKNFFNSKKNILKWVDELEYIYKGYSDRILLFMFTSLMRLSGYNTEQDAFIESLIEIQEESYNGNYIDNEEFFETLKKYINDDTNNLQQKQTLIYAISEAFDRLGIFIEETIAPDNSNIYNKIYDYQNRYIDADTDQAKNIVVEDFKVNGIGGICYFLLNEVDRLIFEDNTIRIHLSSWNHFNFAPMSRWIEVGPEEFLGLSLWKYYLLNFTKLTNVRPKTQSQSQSQVNTQTQQTAGKKKVKAKPKRT
jgi:hypothetical protein